MIVICIDLEAEENCSQHRGQKELHRSPCHPLTLFLSFCFFHFGFLLLFVFSGLKKLVDWPTFPMIFVDSELIGGLDILKEQLETGEFKEMIA